MRSLFSRKHTEDVLEKMEETRTSNKGMVEERFCLIENAIVLFADKLEVI